MNEIFYVERRSMFNWEVRVKHYGGSFWIGDFWTKKGASEVARRLNEAASDYGWKFASFIHRKTAPSP
jgi:hypothetical protein